MKKVLLLQLLLIILVIGVSGCSKSSSTTKDTDSKKLSNSYDNFTGEDETEITVEKGQTVSVLIEITTEAGAVDVYIAKDNDIDNCNYKGIEIPTTSIPISLTEPGTYTVKVTAKEHKGSYSISWN